jgi:hypothetical protein
MFDIVDALRFSDQILDLIDTNIKHFAGEHAVRVDGFDTHLSLRLTAYSGKECSGADIWSAPESNSSSVQEP